MTIKARSRHRVFTADERETIAAFCEMSEADVAKVEHFVGLKFPTVCLRPDQKMTRRG